MKKDGRLVGRSGGSSGGTGGQWRLGGWGGVVCDKVGCDNNQPRGGGLGSGGGVSEEGCSW
jgi:hypothetical protein